MSETIVVKGTVVTPFEMMPRGAVAVEKGKVAYVGPDTGLEGKIYSVDGYVVPGFIDLHVHGGAGFDVMDAAMASIDHISEYLAAGGTTSFLATTYTASRERLLTAARMLDEAVSRCTVGAKLLGLHMEGPYISPRRTGAQDSAYVRKPSLEEIQQVQDEARGSFRMITLAPEVDEALEVSKSLGREGVVLSAGHSDATYDEMEAAVEAGFGRVTHLFNAMRPFHQRDPGIVGAALTDSRLTVEVIADGLHLHPAALRLAATAKGSDKTSLCSDSIAPAGLPDGEHLFGGQSVYLRGGRCLLRSGGLAGGTTRLNEAVANMVRLAGVPLAQAVEMATSTPARVAGFADSKGSLRRGMDADLTVLDRDFRVLLTMVEGNIVYVRGI